MLNLTNENYKTEVLESATPVVVDFFSVGCGPCRQLAPVFEKVAGKLTDVKFAKAMPDDAMDVFVEHNVSRVPTLIIFKGGKVVDTRAGSMSEEELTNWVTEKSK